MCTAALVLVWRELSVRVRNLGLDPAIFGLGLLFFLVLALVGIFAYIAWRAFTIRYALDDKRLVISCGGLKYTIPLSAINDVHAPGDAVGFKSVVVRPRGIMPNLPGYVVREGSSEQLGRVMSVATAPTEGQLFVRASGVSYGISPSNPSGFMAELKEKRKITSGSPSESVKTELSGLTAWGSTLWADKLVRRLIVAGLVLNVLFFWYMSLVYGSLPARVSLHWNSQAQVDRVGDTIEVLRLPMFALAVWLVNVLIGWWALRRERALTLFLLAGGVAAQVVFWAGALSIVLHA